MMPEASGLFPARYFGFNPPFVGGHQNIMSRQVDEKLIKNDILQLILTIPGERVYRPLFGTKLRLTIFESLDESGLAGLSDNIRQAITDNEDRVKVTQVTTTLSPDGQTITVRVDLTLTNQPLVKYLIEISFNNNGSIRLAR